MSWFRFHETALDDPKVQMLSPELFRTWVNLLCVMQRTDRLPALEDMAFMLRVDPQSLANDINQLITARLIDKTGKGLRPHNWEKWQFKSDSSTERVKRFRERCKKRNETVSETPPDTESDTDTDTESENKKTNGHLLAEQFETWWSAYPKKVAKKAAQAKWLRLVRAGEVTPAELMAGLERYCKSEDVLKNFICHPTTWLNEGRWADEGTQSIKHDFSWLDEGENENPRPDNGTH